MTNRHVILLLLAASTASAASVTDSARMLPADTSIMVSVESVDGLKAAIQRTAYYELYKDPALQAVVTPALKKIQEKIDEAQKDLWRRRKVENPPKTLPWPQGRVTIGMFLSSKEETVIDEDGEKPSPRPRVDRAERFPDLQLVAIADMGSAVDEAKALAQQLTQSTDEQGQGRRRQRIRDIEFQVFAGDKAKADVNDLFCFGFKDRWLIVGSSIPWIEAVVRQMDRDSGESLATQRAFQTCSRAAGEGDLFFFVNADPLRRMARGLTTDKVATDRIIGVLGLDNVTGLAAAWQIAASKQENVRVKVLLGVAGQKKGIPAILCPASAPISPSERLLSRDVVLCVVANYDVTKIYDQIAKIAMDVAAVDIGFFTQTAMANTGQGEGQPPLNLRNDILAQISPPLILSWRMGKPYTDAKNSKTLVAAASRDAEKLDTALARVHQALLAKSQPDLQRKMLDHTLYLLPPIPIESPFLAQMGTMESIPKQFAAAVSGDTLAFGETDVVEQVIRDSQGTPSDPLSSEPLFRHAKRFLPSEAGAYWYQNSQRYWEILWTLVRTSARQTGASGPRSGDGGADGGESDPDQGFPQPIDELKKVVELDKLPPFDAVKRYFGVSAGYVKEHADGIYMEQVDLRTPE